MPQAFSNWRPTITGTVEYGKSRTRSETSFGGVTASETDQNTTPTSGRIALEQPIFRGFRSFAELRQAEAQVRAQRAVLTTTEQDVLLAAVTAFMDVVRDQAVLELNINNVQVLQRQLEATQDRFQVGEVTRTDVSQAEARRARAIADRIEAEGTLDSSRARYRNVIGEVPGQLAEPVPPTAIPASLDEAITAASEQNPAVISAKYTERAARQNVRVVGGELLPTLTLNAEASRAAETAAPDSERDNQQVIARLTIPFYQAGNTTSRLRQAKQVAGQRRMQIIAARRDAVEDATRSWEDLETARSQVKAFISEVEANMIALEGVREEANAGLRTVLDILDAEQELLDSKVSQVTARRNEVVAAFTLLTSVGQLTAVDLGLAVDAYNPNKHYENVRLKLWGLGDPLPELRDGGFSQ